MRTRTMSLAIAFVAAASLMAAVTSASARRLSVSTRGIRATWEGLRFAEDGTDSVRCPVTLEGSLHSSTFAKVERTLVGHITRASLGPCGPGTIVLLTETLPWHVRYVGFTSTLPEIRAINLDIVGFSVSWTHFATCLYRTSAAEPLKLTAHRNPATGQIIGLETLGAANKISGSGFACIGGYPVHFEGVAAVHVLGIFEGVFVRLI